MDVDKRLAKLVQDLDIANVSSESCSNARRRSLYSDVELFRLDIENKTVNITDAKRVDIMDQLNKLSARLSLHPLPRRQFWWRPLEDSLRFVGLFSLFLFSGVFLSLPIIGLKVVDNVLIKLNVICPLGKLSEKLRRFVGMWFVVVSGVSLTVDGLEEGCFKDSCVIMTFAHASNLDGFLVSSTCPVPHFALAKMELFLVPFFSWISLAFGGVPVDRKNRDRAVQALQRSTEAAKSGHMCLVIAPEGTRSTTGQLQEFKKGAFHMWEQLQSPIVPFLTFGAFELFPKASWVNRTGRVHVRYLTPIRPQEASSRQEMGALVRRRMLEALKNCPEGLDREVSTGAFWAHMGATVGTIALTVLSVRHLLTHIVTPTQFAVGSAGITVGLYVHYVYLINMWPFTGPSSRKNGAYKTPLIFRLIFIYVRLNALGRSTAIVSKRLGGMGTFSKYVQTTVSRMRRSNQYQSTIVMSSSSGLFSST